MRTLAAVGAVLVAVATFGCGSDTPAAPTAPAVTTGGGGGIGAPAVIAILGGNDSQSFRPSNVTVAPGAAITWLNSDQEGIFHRAVADDGSFDTGDLDWQSESKPIVLTKSVTYRCANHPTETGSITVGSSQ